MRVCVSFDLTMLYLGVFPKEIIRGFGKQVCTREFVMVLLHNVESCL